MHPPIPRPPDRPGPRSRRGRRWRHPARSRAVVGGALAAGALVLAACSSTPPAAHGHAPSHPTTTTAVASAALCPLTGAPVPGGGPVPARTALAVKVDNYPAARPQSGLDKADIVFEEPVEGGITRYVAVFQCQNAPLVGPIRSARNIDIGILGQLGSPVLVHVGGIPPVLANIEASPLVNLDLGQYGAVAQHPAGRYAPYDTYASTKALWGVGLGSKTPPTPLFTYSAAPPPGGAKVSAVAIPFSGTSDVVWNWVAQFHRWERSYGNEPDMLDDDVQNSAANVIVQFIDVYYGPYVENEQGALEVQANLYGGVSGKAEVFRNGEEIDGTWQRGQLSDPTQFLDAAGQQIPLAPGPTWVELVPTTIPVTTDRGAPAP